MFLPKEGFLQEGFLVLTHFYLFKKITIMYGISTRYLGMVDTDARSPLPWEIPGLRVSAICSSIGDFFL